MKLLKKILFIFTLIFSVSHCYSQDSSYILRAVNFENTAPNIIDFDIYIENSDPAVPLKFSAGQFAFDIDTNILNGGKLSFTIAPANPGDSSDLPNDMIPKTAIIDNDRTGKIYLRTAVLPSLLFKEGFEITNKESSGIRIIKLRISTSADEFAKVPFDLSWRNAPDNIYTKIFVFDGKKVVEVTNPLNHMMLVEKVK